MFQARTHFFGDICALIYFYDVIVICDGFHCILNGKIIHRCEEFSKKYPKSSID